MKTRIVYPQMWLDEKFAECSIPTKLLFCYLITNLQLGLTEYLHISDRQMMFDTGLSSNQLETAKKELTNLRWCFFTEGWVFHNHKCAYINYEGRDRVIQAVDKELASVPEDVKEYFKGLVTGSEPLLNQKSKTINQKSKTEEESVREGEVVEVKEKDYTKIETLDGNDLQEIADRYQVPLAFVVSKHEDMILWAGEKAGRTKGRNWRLTLMNWVKKDAHKIRKEAYHDNAKRGIDARNVK